MSTAPIWQTDSSSSEATLRLGETIGAKLRGGEVLELRSDLGGGKTTFVRGLAKGMGTTDVVHSPSFTISNQYKTNHGDLYHFDFYRLADAGIMRDELAEVLETPDAVVVIEWADIVEDVLPAEHITVTITATDEQSRTFLFEYPEKCAYLFPANT